MIRIQIQLPDEIHARAKGVAAAQGISLEELARRGLELVLAQTPKPEEFKATWRPPTVRGLGWKGLSHRQIEDAAHMTAAEEELEDLASRPADV
jgi:hypothetical protein